MSSGKPTAGRSWPARAFLCAGAALLAVAAPAWAPPARALTIKATFDSSVTSQSDAAQIESAFNTVAKVYDKNLTSPVTVNIKVSLGSVDGQSLGGASVLADTVDNFYGYFTYGQVKSYLAAAAAKTPGDAALVSAAASLPASITGMSDFAIPYSEAKALGVIPATQVGTDAYIGFNSTAKYDFDPADGVTAGDYDFQALAAHEIAHALGRLSGLQSKTPDYRTPLDLFRYAADEKLSFGYSTAAYFSIDGGATSIGDFNDLVNGADRDAWLAKTTGVGDVQAPSQAKGLAYSISSADLTALQALGWGAPGGSGVIGGKTLLGGAAMLAAPEPQAWLMMILGVGAVGADLRRRRNFAMAASLGA